MIPLDPKPVVEAPIPSNPRRERQTDMTSTNQIQSPLLRLPAEIRNRIYEHYFAITIPMLPSRSDNTPGPASSVRGPIALLLTGRQLNAEASQLLRTVPMFALISRFAALDFPIRCDITSVAIELQLAGRIITSASITPSLLDLRELFPQLRHLTVTGEPREITKFHTGSAILSVSAPDDSEEVERIENRQQFMVKLCRAFGKKPDGVEVHFELK